MRGLPVVPLILVLMVASACGSSSSDSDKAESGTKASAAQGKQPDEAARNALVHVQGHYSETKTVDATGFVWDADRGLVMTANHAVEAAPDVHVILGDGESLNGRVVGRAQCHDLAIVKVNPSGADLDQIVWGGDAKLGQTVRSLTFINKGNESYHDGMTMVETRGTVAAVNASVSLTPHLPAFDGLVGHQSPLSRVSAGSPLLDARGRVIGMNTLSGRRYGAASPRGVNYAQSARSINALLDLLVPGKRAVFSGWSAEHVCHEGMNRLAGLPAGTSHKNPVGTSENEEHSHGEAEEGK